MNAQNRVTMQKIVTRHCKKSWHDIP